MTTKTNKGLDEGRNRRHSHRSQCNHSCMLYGLDRILVTLFHLILLCATGRGLEVEDGVGRGR